ncbi:MAG: hypothetical protein ACQEP8_02630 [Chlamydiota bacterium]
MKMGRRALYNLLRMNSQRDTSLKAEEWQITDYRQIPTEQLLNDLEKEGLKLNQKSFIAYAENYNSPEEFTEDIIPQEADIPVQDRIYLVIFELWRRLLPHSSNFTIFCDELDHQINIYDLEEIESSSQLQDMIAQLQKILDENADESGNAQEVFAMLLEHSANDLEGFLYDFIAEQIDNECFSYAAELLDGFIDYISDKEWFDFLRARLLILSDPQEANNTINKIIKSTSSHPDVALYLEILSFLARNGEQGPFTALASKTLPLIETQQDFYELLEACIEFTNCLDFEYYEKQLDKIIKSRKPNLNEPVDHADPAFLKVSKIIDELKQL